MGVGDRVQEAEMTDMISVDSEIRVVEQAIREREEFVIGIQESIRDYKQMIQTEITAEYIGVLMCSSFRCQDEIDKLKKERNGLWNYKFHKGEWWKCPNCGTTNSPFRHTCDNCI